jgi:predicted amidohydrolase
MDTDRRKFLEMGLAAATGASAAARTIPVALIQSDSAAEQVERNLANMERLSEEAVARGARWVMFHEGTLTDYTPRLAELAEAVPEGRSVRRMEALARRLKCWLSWGLSENAHGRYYIAQVFTGPEGYVYHYRKSWIWRDATDQYYRNEWARYDTGTGPEAFTFDGVRATCFICADGEAPRCIARAAEVKPQVVFYPNNRSALPEFEVFGARARAIGAPMLVTNRVGLSWGKPTRGGSVVYSATGEVLAKANREGREEILRYELKI